MSLADFVGLGAEHETATAGWYPDAGGAQLRWWDGSAWMHHVAPVPTSDPVLSAEFLAERKRVYSHDMLYVTDAAGTRVGRINLESGKVTMDLPELRPALDQFVARWRAENGPASEAVGTSGDDHGITTATLEVQPVTSNDAHGASTATLEGQPTTTVDPAHLDEPATDGPAWQDLSQNQAGEAVRERAIELRSKAPVKTFLARLFGVHTDERAYRVGADGEVEVAWRLRNSRHEAARASKLLTAACGFDVQVQPIIVAIAADLTIKAQPADVHVVAHKRIGKWLEGRPATLSPVAVEAIFDMARRDTTWRTNRAK